eukprot:TRINITY_DN11680_c0_g1_i1.p1 TRINITY_DN11680_c0_g1~~TRINITY_DN11680_c0_g1_i1.p1  ORF type:complete len:902 (-),score=229.69 TRINITY_DN11680_c0_g1_i1:36-2741(-)
MKLLLLGLTIIALSHAAIRTWTYDFTAGPDFTTREWSNTENWENGNVPQNGDDVVIEVYPGDAGYTVKYTINVGNDVTDLDFASLKFDSPTSSIDGNSLNVGRLEFVKGHIRDMTLTITSTGSTFEDAVYFNNVDLIINSEADVSVSCQYLYLGESTNVNVAGTLESSTFNYNIEAQSGWDPANSEDTNCKITIESGGNYLVKDDVSVKFIEFDLQEGATLTIDVENIADIIADDTSFDNGDENVGSPSTLAGYINIIRGEFKMDGGDVTWKDTSSIDACEECYLSIGGQSDYIGTHNFEGALSIRNLILNSDAIIESGDINVGSFEWKAGSIAGTTVVNASNVFCGNPLNVKNRQIVGDDAILYIAGESEMSNCEIYLEDGGSFIIREGATVSSLTDDLQFDSTDMVNPGTFINYGKMVLQPSNPINGGHEWINVNFKHYGEIKCLLSTEYNHCFEIRNYEGTSAVSESAGVFIVDSGETNYLADFETWPPVLISGNMYYKEGHSFEGNGIVRLWGDSGNCDEDDSEECRRLLQQTFEESFHFTQLNFESYIEVILEEDLEVDYCYWNGGLITGSDLIINEELTIDYQGLTDSELLIDGSTIEIKKKLNMINARIAGYNGAKIIINDGAVMEIGDDNYIGDDVSLDDNENWDFRLINDGVMSVKVNDYKPAESGRVKIRNNGVFKFNYNEEDYSNPGARPVFYVADLGEMAFTDTSTLEINIRRTQDDVSDYYESSDFLDFYEASRCVLGGKLKINFIQPIDCASSCDQFTPVSGDRFKIMSHRRVDDSEEFPACALDFDEIEAEGLGSGLILGVDYNVQNPDLSSMDYIEVVVCEEGETCGSTNENQEYIPDETEEEGEDEDEDSTGSGSNGTGPDDTDSSAISLVCAFSIVMASIILL